MENSVGFVFVFNICPLSNMKGSLFWFCARKKKVWIVDAKKYDNKSISHKHHQSRGNTDHDT